MEIRIATVNDFDSIVEIYLAAPPSSAALGAVVARSRYFESPGKDVFVVLDETPRVVGYASVIRQAQDLPLIPSELEEIRIAPPSQHRGYGTALLEWMRSTNQCDTWVRCQRNDERAIAWFKKQGYEYRRTEFSETGVLTVLMRPGQITHRAAQPSDLPAMHDLFVASVFLNPNIVHGTAIPNDFATIMAGRVFPKPDAGFIADSVVYRDAASRLAGFHVTHRSASFPRQVELNMFCSDAKLGAKDLGNYMLQRVIELYGNQAAVMVRTWQVNKRAMSFYMKNGFAEAEREDPEETAKEGRPAKITLIRPGPPKLFESSP